jgi:large conductance mechanosensitive channel
MNVINSVSCSFISGGGSWSSIPNSSRAYGSSITTVVVVEVEVELVVVSAVVTSVEDSSESTPSIGDAEEHAIRSKAKKVNKYFLIGIQITCILLFIKTIGGKLIKEFRDFINRGNVVELGVAFVMGASFKSLVDVFTKRLIEPVIGLLINLPNLETLGLFGDIDPSSGVSAGSFGAFLGEVINYSIIAFVMFLVIKAYNHFEEVVSSDEDETVVAAESKEVQLLKEIRDGINKISK